MMLEWGDLPSLEPLGPRIEHESRLSLKDIEPGTRAIEHCDAIGSAWPIEILSAPYLDDDRRHLKVRLREFHRGEAYDRETFLCDIGIMPYNLDDPETTWNGSNWLERVPA